MGTAQKAVKGRCTHSCLAAPLLGMCVQVFQAALFLFSRDGQITAILDQKNYVEELNRHLR